MDVSPMASDSSNAISATRQEILDSARTNVLGQRQQDYGTPESNFQNIANLWEAYKGSKFTATDVAIMMALVKIARLKTTPCHKDSWVDLAGYAACGAEVSRLKNPATYSPSNTPYTVTLVNQGKYG